MRSILPILLVLLDAAPAFPAEKAPGIDVFPFEWGGGIESILPVDLDGDGLLDLVCARAGALEVRFGRKGAGYSPAPDDTLRLAARSVGWCTASLARGGTPLVAALLDGREVKVWAVDPVRRAFAEGRTLRDRLTGSMPGGIHFMPFLRDLNGDGTADLVVPGARGFLLYLGEPGGTYGEGLTVPGEIEVRTRLSGDDLSGRIGQEVTLPLFALRDLNGDGRPDLLTETEDRIEAFLSGKDGRFGAAPAWAIDLAAARAALGPNDLDSLDTSNLTAALAKTVQALPADIDGDRAEDVVLRASGKLSLFLSRGGRIDPRRPDQVLKSSGNVVHATLEDEDGDGRPDLWLVQIEPVSVGDLFIWLIASGKIGLDIFIYRNEGGRFAGRPSRRLAVTVRFASILSLLDQVKKLGARERPGRGVHPGDLAGKGERRDLAVVEQEKLRIFLGRAPETAGLKLEKGRFLLELLKFFGYRRDKDEYEVDLTNLADSIARFEGILPAKPQGVEPDLDVPLPGAGGNPGAYLLDLNGDRRDDLLLIYERTPERTRGAVLLSRES